MRDFNAEETGQRIKELRCECELTQSALADKIGVKQNTVAQYEKGTAKPSLEILVKLAVVLQTTTDYILGLTE